MIRERYESLSLAVLRDLAKARGLKGVSALRKPELIDRMCEEDAKEEKARDEGTREETAGAEYTKEEKAGELTEDDVKKDLEEIQKLTDKCIKDIDDIIANKGKELMEL